MVFFAQICHIFHQEFHTVLRSFYIYMDTFNALHGSQFNCVQNQLLPKGIWPSNTNSNPAKKFTQQHFRADSTKYLTNLFYSRQNQNFSKQNKTRDSQQSFAYSRSATGKSQSQHGFSSRFWNAESRLLLHIFISLQKYTVVGKLLLKSS